METYTRVYDTYNHAARAVTALEQAGVPAHEISLVANKHVSNLHEMETTAEPAATGAGVGAAIGGGAGLLAGLGLLAIPGLGPVVAVGWLASTALGLVAGGATGGVIGALVGAGVSEDDAHVYSEVVRRGGTLLTVKTDMAASRVNAILDAYSPIDAKVRRAEYAKNGWSKFDPTLPPYDLSATERERLRNM